eukprot:7274756-Prymnesium_polylepis.2
MRVRAGEAQLSRSGPSLGSASRSRGRRSSAPTPRRSGAGEHAAARAARPAPAPASALTAHTISYLIRQGHIPRTHARTAVAGPVPAARRRRFKSTQSASRLRS